MIKINLLASDSIKKEERQEWLFIGYFIILVIVVLAGARYGIQYRSYSKVKGYVAQTQQELKSYETIVNQVETLQKTKATLESQKGVINSLMALRLMYPYLMEDIVESLPDTVWLKTMRTKIVEAGVIQVQIEAESLENISIADFVLNLSKNPRYTETVLGQINSVRGAHATTSSFSITFKYRPGVRP